MKNYLLLALILALCYNLAPGAFEAFSTTSLIGVIVILAIALPLALMGGLWLALNAIGGFLTECLIITGDAFCAAWKSLTARPKQRIDQ